MIIRLDKNKIQQLLFKKTTPNIRKAQNNNNCYDQDYDQIFQANAKTNKWMEQYLMQRKYNSGPK